jgi:hypothetical protein
MNSPTQTRFNQYPAQSTPSEKTTRYVEPVEDAQVAAADADFMLCCYQNLSPKMQIVRSNSLEIPEWHLERVVFPGQRLLFHAPHQTSLQIYTASMAGNLLSDTVPCDRLRVDES